MLKDKIIVITGASQGLGKTLALKAALEGAVIALVARSEKLLQEVVAEIKSNNGQAEYFVCDISDLSSVKKTQEKILKKFGSIDILINNAAIWTDDQIEALNPEKRKQAFEINALGNIQFTEELLPTFINQKQGYIFNVISSAGTDNTLSSNNGDWRVYGASKWALAGYTKALQDKFKGTNIRTTGFFPGGFDSNLYLNAGKEDLQHAHWMMKIEDVADVIIFCLTRPTDLLIEQLNMTKVH